MKKNKSNLTIDFLIKPLIILLLLLSNCANVGLTGFSSPSATEPIIETNEEFKEILPEAAPTLPPVAIPTPQGTEDDMSLPIPPTIPYLHMVQASAEYNEIGDKITVKGVTIDIETQQKKSLRVRIFRKATNETFKLVSSEDGSFSMMFNAILEDDSEEFYIYTVDEQEEITSEIVVVVPVKNGTLNYSYLEIDWDALDPECIEQIPNLANLENNHAIKLYFKGKATLDFKYVIPKSLIIEAYGMQLELERVPDAFYYEDDYLATEETIEKYIEPFEWTGYEEILAKLLSYPGKHSEEYMKPGDDDDEPVDPGYIPGREAIPTGQGGGGGPVVSTERPRGVYQTMGSLINILQSTDYSKDSVGCIEESEVQLDVVYFANQIDIITNLPHFFNFY